MWFERERISNHRCQKLFFELLLGVGAALVDALPGRLGLLVDPLQLLRLLLEILQLL